MSLYFVIFSFASSCTNLGNLSSHYFKFKELDHIKKYIFCFTYNTQIAVDVPVKGLISIASQIIIIIRVLLINFLIFILLGSFIYICGLVFYFYFYDLINIKFSLHLKKIILIFTIF